MWPDQTVRHRHSRAQTRRQRCYQSLGATASCPTPRNIPMTIDFPSTLTCLISCILSCFVFFLSWTVLLLWLSSAPLSVFKWDLPCNLQMIKITVFAKIGSWKKLLVIADLSTYQVTLGRLQLSCELRPPLSGKVQLFSLWGVTAERRCGKCARFEILSKFPLLVCELAQWQHCLPSAEVGEESPSHVVLIESKSHFMWLHGFVQALWRSQPSCLEMSVSCKAIRNHCWNTQAASTRLELRSGKHQRWVVVLILIPLSNMWWC